MEKNFEKYSNKNGTIYHGDALDILSSNKHSMTVSANRYHYSA